MKNTEQFREMYRSNLVMNPKEHAATIAWFSIV